MAGDVLEFAGDKNLALVVGNFVDHDVVIVLLVQAEDKLLHRRVHVQQQPLVNLALALYMHTRTYLHVYTLAPRDTCIHIHTHAPTPRDSHATTHTQPQQLSAGGGRRRQEAAGGGRRRQEAAGTPPPSITPCETSSCNLFFLCSVTARERLTTACASALSCLLLAATASSLHPLPASLRSGLKVGDAAVRGAPDRSRQAHLTLRGGAMADVKPEVAFPLSLIV